MSLGVVDSRFRGNDRRRDRREAGMTGAGMTEGGIDRRRD